MARGGSASRQPPPPVVGEPLISCASYRRRSIAVESCYAVSHGGWALRRSPTTYWTAEAPSFTALGTAVEAAIAVKSVSPKLPTVEEILQQTSSLCGERSSKSTSKDLAICLQPESEQSTSIREIDDYRSEDASTRLIRVTSVRAASADVAGLDYIRRAEREFSNSKVPSEVTTPRNCLHSLSRPIREDEEPQLLPTKSYIHSISSSDGTSNVSTSIYASEVDSYESWNFMAHRELLLSALSYEPQSSHKINVWFYGEGNGGVEGARSPKSDANSHSSMLAQSSCSFVTAAPPTLCSVNVSSSITLPSDYEWMIYTESLSMGCPRTATSRSIQAKSLPISMHRKVLRVPRRLSILCSTVHLLLCPVPFVRNASRVAYFLLVVNLLMCLTFLLGYTISKSQTQSYQSINHRITRHLGSAVCLGTCCGCLVLLGLRIRYNPENEYLECVDTPLGCVELIETYLPLPFTAIFMLWIVLVLVMQQRLKCHRIPFPFSLYRLMLAALMFATSLCLTISCAFAYLGTILVGCVTSLVTFAPVTSTWCCGHLALRPLIITSALLSLIIICILVDVFSSPMDDLRMIPTIIIPIAQFSTALVAIAQGRHLCVLEKTLNRSRAIKVPDRSFTDPVTSESDETTASAPQAQASM